MFFYLLLALLTVVASYLGLTSSTKRTKEVSLLVAWIAFLLIVGLRYHHGDYGTYEMGYKYDQDVGGDFGYFALQKIFHRMGAPFWFFAFLITLLSVYCFKKIFSISPWPAFGLIFLLGKIFTLYAMSGIRQYMAMAVCWWALYQLLVYRRDAVFLCSVLLAYSLHGSALIFLPVWFLRRIKFSWIWLLLILVISISLAYTYKTLFGAVANSSDLINDRLGSYVEESQEGGEGMNMLNYLENSLFLILALMVRKRARKVVPYYDTFLYMFAIYLGFLIVGNEIGIIKRLRDYYAIAYAILCPSFIFLFRDIRLKKATYYLLVCYFVFLFFRSLAVYDAPFPPDTEGRMVPYHSIFSYSDILF
jgi:hypothetical protein